MGTGWPFGRDVYRSEILQAIDEVEGVDHVLALELVANDGEPHCANICLPPTGLVESGKHQIVVEGEPCRKLEPRDLERMRYHQGQMLRSRDFHDLATNESHLRWWHKSGAPPGVWRYQRF